MSEAAGELNLERLLTDALRPVEPPEDLGDADGDDALRRSPSRPRPSSRAGPTSSPRASSRRCATRATGSARWPRSPPAAPPPGALVLVGMRRRRAPDGLRETAGRLLRDLR